MLIKKHITNILFSECRKKTLNKFSFLPFSFKNWRLVFLFVFGSIPNVILKIGFWVTLELSHVFESRENWFLGFHTTTHHFHFRVDFLKTVFAHTNFWGKKLICGLFLSILKWWVKKYANEVFQSRFPLRIM